MKRRLNDRVVFGLLFGAYINLGAIFCLGSYAYGETAQVLPQGRSRLSFVYAQTDGIDQQFNDQGTRESITHDYNIALNSENLKKVKSSQFGNFSSLIDALNSMPYHYDASKRADPNTHGVALDNTGPLIGDAISRGFLDLDAQAHQQQYVTSYQYGLTKRLTIGFMVPVVSMNVNAGANIVGNNSASDISAYLHSNGKLNSQLENGLTTLSQVNQSTLQQLLQARDYSSETSWNNSGLGDVVLGARYNYISTKYDRFLSSFQLGTSVPTGKLRDPGAPLQQDFGHGAWYIEAANIINYSPLQWLTLSNGTHFGHFLKSQRQLRVDSTPDEFLPDASDQQDVGMQLGDKISTNFGLDFKVSQTVLLNTSYEFDWKKHDTYTGDRPIDYSYLSDDTNTYQQVAQFGAQISSIPSFMKAEFPVPMTLALNFYIPTTGRNLPIAPYGTAELALYF